MALDDLELQPAVERGSPRSDRGPPAGVASLRNSLASRARRSLFGIPSRDVLFSTRGFDLGDEADRLRLEGVGAAFAEGYHAALEVGSGAGLELRLCTLSPRLRGFAYEGAALALGLFDILAPWRRDRWRTLLEGPGKPFDYLVHVGLGWAFARLRRPADATLPGMDPLLGCLCVDGYGFHEAYFHWPRFAATGTPRRHLSPQLRPLFDQGVGRALWFGRAADPQAIEATVDSYAAERRGDLWSGAGLALAYAGRERPGAPQEALVAAGEHRAHLAQGVAFAAEARLRQGAPDETVQDACAVVWGRSAEDVAARVRHMRRRLGEATGAAGYAAWRAGVRAEHFKAGRE